MKLAISALMVAALAAGSAASTDARACGFFDYREVRPVVKKPVFVAANDRIAAADQRLEEAKNEAAGLEVVTAFPQVRGVAVGASPLETRALRILSLAVVRADGSLAGVKGFAGTTASQRTASIDWAIQTLRAVDAQKHDDPVAKADLAEALARSPRGEDEALSILTDLTGRDLVGSAHAYAALARLRSARGDATGARTALARCEGMTRSPSTVCRAPDGRVAMRD
jgi:hypothetical protein